MDKAKNVVYPGETSIVTADQPPLVIAKQIQREWHNLYGEDKFIVMFGGLHNEMTCYKILGDIYCVIMDGHMPLLKPILQHLEQQILLIYFPYKYLFLETRIR